MPNFAYTAFDTKGIEARGALQMASLNEACQRLKDMGLFPTKVVEQHDKPDRRAGALPAAGKRPRRFSAALQISIPGLGTRVKPKVLTTFTRQVATLVEAGMPLLRGLRLLEEQQTHRPFKQLIARLVTNIEEGASFSEALSQHPKVFDRLYLNMVRAGEASGALEIVLKRLAVFLEKAQRIKGKVLAALYYPSAVLFVAFGILTGLIVWIVPKFREVFAEMLGTSRMPAFTQFVLNISDVVSRHFLWAAAILVAGIVGLKLATKTHAGRAMWDRFKLKMPLLGPVFSKVAVARFTRTLSTLMGSGVPILQALTIVKETAGNDVVRQAVEKVHEAVKEGESIAAPLKASSVFPAMVVGMVDVGEQTGALPDMLSRIADIYDEEVDNAVAGMTSLLEPILIIFLAVIVGTIVVAMFLPIIAMVTDPDFDQAKKAS